MARIAKSGLARRVHDGAIPAHGRQTRARMTAEWNLVLDMLSGAKPRRTKDGRNITQVWADMVLADPPGEFARVAQYRLPPETAPDAGAGAVITNIQSLYLSAMTSVNARPGAAISDTTSHKTIEGDQGANGVQPDLSDW